MKGRRPRPLDDGDSGEVRVSGHLSWAKPIENKRVFCLTQSATITFMTIISILSSTLPVPIIASGGGGVSEHFYDVFTKGKADAALAASIFHYKELAIPDLKNYLHQKGIPVRV